MKEKRTAIILSLISCLTVGLFNLDSFAVTGPRQDPFEKNSCVTCHRNISSPLDLSHRFYDWHISVHKEKGVGCEACHGGNPTSNDIKAAHTGMFPSLEASSKSNPKNQAETCGACHKDIRTKFVTSQHYLKLSLAGIGPTCANCHQQMANSTARSPNDTAALCSTCHNTVGGLMQPRPDIIKKTQETMLALSRARSVVIWAERLLEVAQEKKLAIADEQRAIQEVKRALSEAAAEWHDFRFTTVRTKADQAFEMGTKVKDKLLAKLYPSQNK